MLKGILTGLFILLMILGNVFVTKGLTSFEDDFSTDKGWISSTPPDIYRDAANENVVWHAYRGRLQYMYKNLTNISIDEKNFSLQVDGIIDNRTNNCWIQIGVTDNSGFALGQMPGIAIQFGWYGGGTPYTHYYAFVCGKYTDGTYFQSTSGHVGDNTWTGYIDLTEDTWYHFNLTVTDNKWTLTATNKVSGNQVGSISGTLAGDLPQISYTYFANLDQNDWPTMDGKLDDFKLLTSSQIICSYDDYEEPHSPESNKALIIVPFYDQGFKGYTNDLKSKLKESGFKHVDYMKNKEVTIPDLVEWLKNSYGIIHIMSHGDPDYVVIEHFNDKNTRDERWEELRNMYGLSMEEMEKVIKKVEDEKKLGPFERQFYWIGITGEFIKLYCQNLPDHPLVFFEACYMGVNNDMKEAFLCKGAGAYVGYADMASVCTIGYTNPLCIKRTIGEGTRDFYYNLIDRGLSVRLARLSTENVDKNYNDRSVPLVSYGKDEYLFIPLMINATCPVDLSIIDPDGLTMSKNSSEIQNSTYSENDINNDGDPDDIILIPVPKIGEYLIIVIPESDAASTDMYTLQISSGGQTITLAEKVLISDIPSEPYKFYNTSGISPIIVNSQVMLIIQNVIWNLYTKIFAYDVAIQNIGSEPLYWPIKTVINNIYPTSVTLNNPDGGGNGVGGYWDYSNSAGEGTLSPGEISEAKRWEFYNPNMTGFYFSCDIYAVTPSSLPKSADSEGNLPITMTIDIDQQQVKLGKGDITIPEISIPKEFVLEQSYPNPFNSETMIKYQLPEATTVSLKILNLLGQEIRTLVDGHKAAGYHVANWDGKDNSGKNVASGIYIYRIQAGDFVDMKKMELIR